MSNKIKVYDNKGKTVDELELNPKVFDKSVNYPLLRQAILMYEANQRQGTASTKTRGKVRGGGRKPWAQKGTGRARVGSIRSPIWRGGGITFGPQPRDFSYKIPKKIRHLALKSSLNAKLEADKICILDELSIESPKTKIICDILKKLKLYQVKVLLVTEEGNKNIVLSCKNIKDLALKRIADLTCYDVLKYENLLITKSAFSCLNDVKKSTKPKTKAVSKPKATSSKKVSKSTGKDKDSNKSKSMKIGGDNERNSRKL